MLGDPKREVTERRFGRVVELAHAIAPPVWERLSARLFGRLAFRGGEAAPSAENLFEPLHGD